jgi:hypothetical protein
VLSPLKHQGPLLAASAVTLSALGCVRASPAFHPWNSTFAVYSDVTCEEPLPYCRLASIAVPDVQHMAFCEFYAAERGPKRWLVAFDKETTDCELRSLLCDAHGVLVSWNRATFDGLVIFPGTPQLAARRTFEDHPRVHSIVDEFGTAPRGACGWDDSPPVL